MPITKEEFAEFTHFAEQKLSNGGVNSFDELLRQWREARELNEPTQDIRHGEADIAAGQVKPLDQALADIREKLGWNK